MFQLALRLGGVEVQQDADAARYAVGNRDLRRAQQRRRAARAGYSAVRSGDDVKIALSTSSGWKPFACWSPRNSSAVASRMAGPVFAAAVVAPRSPRRVLLMALVDQLRLMVITDA